MAIDTYATLQTAVSNWLARSDLSVRIPEFISLGEARIQREVRSRLQEQRVTTDVSTYINVPSDFLELRSIWVTSGSTAFALQYLVPDALFAMYPSTSAGGLPKHYTIFGDEIKFGPVPDSTYTVELWYFKRLEALSSAVNTLFTRNPDLYLYASLTSAIPFLKDDKRIQTWESLYQMIKNQVNGTEEAGRRATMQVVVA